MAKPIASAVLQVDVVAAPQGLERRNRDVEIRPVGRTLDVLAQQSEVIGDMLKDVHHEVQIGVRRGVLKVTGMRR